MRHRYNNAACKLKVKGETLEFCLLVVVLYFCQLLRVFA